MKNNKQFYVHQSSFIDDDEKIGENSKIWHFSHIQSGARIGANCVLGQNVNVGNNVIIGDNVKIQNNVSIYEGVEIHDFVFCGPSIVFTNILKPRSEFPQQGSKFYQKTVIKKSASLGANATIVCGSTIGQYSLVGAGTVVTKSVPNHALVIGNPAKIIGWIDKMGNKLNFDKEGKSECGEFILKSGSLKKVS